MNAKLNYGLLKARKNRYRLLPNGQAEKSTQRVEGSFDNVIVLGGPDTGKTYGVVGPEILSGVCGASMVIADTRGLLYEQYQDILKEMGYDVSIFDFENTDRSARYNILENIDSPGAVERLSDMIVYHMTRRDNVGDKLWSQSEVMLLNALIGYLMENGKGIEKNPAGVNRLISLFDAEAIENNKPCDATRVFEYHRERYKKLTGEDSWAYEQFKKFTGISSRMFGSVLMSTITGLNPFDTKEMRKMLSDSDFDILSIEGKRTAVFVNMSDTDRSKDIVISIFWTQILERLCRYADSLPEKRLPVPVRFILDDFGKSTRIEGFESMISSIRSRGISATLTMQSLSQLERSYNAGASAILTNCAVKIYTGGSDPETARYFSTLTNKPFEKILNMPMMTHWLVRQGEQPVFGRTVLLNEYELDERRYPESDTV